MRILKAEIDLGLCNSIYVDTDSYTPIKSYVFGQVKNQEFPAHASILDSRLYKKDDLLKFSNGTYPLIIKMASLVGEEEV